jgi:hypothetical protein
MVPLFSLEVFLLSPMRFRGASFFIKDLFAQPLRFKGAFFSSEVFLLSPLHFNGASFFIGGLFSQ